MAHKDSAIIQQMIHVDILASMFVVNYFSLDALLVIRIAQINVIPITSFQFDFSFDSISALNSQFKKK